MKKSKTESLGSVFLNVSENYVLQGHLKGRKHIERVKLTAFYSKVAGIYLNKNFWEYVAFGNGRNSFNRVFPIDLIIKVSVLAKIPFIEMSPNSKKLSDDNNALLESLLLMESVDAEDAEAVGL
jgi:hypothetical protein